MSIHFSDPIMIKIAPARESYFTDCSLQHFGVSSLPCAYGVALNLHHDEMLEDPVQPFIYPCRRYTVVSLCVDRETTLQAVSLRLRRPSQSLPFFHSLWPLNLQQ